MPVEKDAELRTTVAGVLHSSAQHASPAYLNLAQHIYTKQPLNSVQVLTYCCKLWRRRMQLLREEMLTNPLDLNRGIPKVRAL